MTAPVTLFIGQGADLTLEEVANYGGLSGATTAPNGLLRSRIQ
jgi:hypothetical protein